MCLKATKCLENQIHRSIVTQADVDIQTSRKEVLITQNVIKIKYVQSSKFLIFNGTFTHPLIIVTQKYTNLHKNYYFVTQLSRKQNL